MAFRSPRATRPLATPPAAAAARGDCAWPTAWAQRVVAVVLGALALLLSPSGASAVESVSVQLGARHQFQFAGYYLALDRGYYRAAGLDVELRPGGPGARDPLAAVLEGKADFGIASSALSAARMRGQPLVVLAAVLQQSPAMWLVQPDLATEPLSRLAQRRVLGPSDPSAAGELIALMARHGLQPQALKPAGDPAAALEAFARGDVDVLAASALHDVPALAARGVPHALLNPRDHDLHFYGEVLFTSERNADRRPSTVDRFVQATLRGWSEALMDVPATARLIQARWAPDQTAEQLLREGQAFLALSASDEIEVGHMSRIRWANIAEIQRSMDDTLRPLDTAAFLFGERRRDSALWPDPVRIGLAASLIGALLCLILLLRHNRELKQMADSARTEVRDVRAAELRFHFLMDVAPFPIVIFNVEDGRIQYTNEHALGWLSAHAVDDVHEVGSHFPLLKPGSAELQGLRESGMIRELEMELPRESAANASTPTWCLVTVRLIDYQGKPSGFATFSDISSRKNAELELRMLNEQRGRVLNEVEQLQTRLREASLRDALTGLLNRRYFDATLVRELSHCRRSGQPLSLLVVDADHFKRINDTAGHAAGDEVLRRLADVLSQHFRRTEDVVCRFGGEEFAIILPGTAREAAVSRSEAAREAIQAMTVTTTAGELHVTASIGIAVIPPEMTTADEAFRMADTALYRAKSDGRNRVAVFGDPPTPAAEAA